MILFALAMIILMVVLAVVVVWPSYVHSVEKQSSDRFWAAAKPFAVREHRMYPNQMVLEIYNAEPVTLTIKRVYLDTYSLDFSNHSVPFTWASASARCGGGSCNMTMRPGQTQIISTANFTSSPVNPCVVGGGFIEGNRYKMDLVITYHASNAAALENESATFKLVGECAAS